MRKKRSKHDDAAEVLFRAVASYVKKHGGEVAVAGPVQLIPFGGKYRFGLVIECVGTEPQR